MRCAVRRGEYAANDLQAQSVEKRMAFSHDTLRVQCIIPKLSKSIIDEIDAELAVHYGLTPGERDFIANYDIKYRMGQEQDEGDECNSSPTRMREVFASLTRSLVVSVRDPCGGLRLDSH